MREDPGSGKPSEREVDSKSEPTGTAEGKNQGHVQTQTAGAKCERQRAAIRLEAQDPWEQGSDILQALPLWSSPPAFLGPLLCTTAHHFSLQQTTQMPCA